MSALRGVLVVLLLALQVQGRPQFDSDACIFDDSDPDCGGGQGDNCFESLNEIDSAIFQGDTRSAFKDCDNSRKCSFYARQGFTCAQPWTCTENRTIITDGKGLIDVRQALSGVFTLDSSDGKCDDENRVCCRHPDFRAQRPADPSNQPLKQVVDEKKKWAECGRYNEESKISGDSLESANERAQPSEFPHMCVIYQTVRGQRAYLGGASLIARNKILTVAHKFLRHQRGRDRVDGTQAPGDYSVRCGQYNVKKEDGVLPFQESEVEEIYIHPDYDEEEFFNNLAILRTRENFLYQLHIGPVCLPRPFEDFTKSGKGDTERCWSSGWGADQFDASGVYSDNMKKVTLGVVPREECQTRMQATDRFKNKRPRFKLDDSWMCIGGEEGKDTCKGDGGSPHVCKSLDSEKWTQVGAVAWGVECGKAVPAVYSSIPDAMCWIDWVMSCKPESDKFIDDLFLGEEGLLDLRADTSNPDSVNSITVGDCQDWLDEHPVLADECSVHYTRIEERTNLDDALFEK